VGCCRNSAGRRCDGSVSGAAAGRPSRSLTSSPPAAFSLLGRNATLTKLNSETLRIPFVFEAPRRIQPVL
jgi:hypothetical protein